MGPEAPQGEAPLGSWLRVFAPAYRGLLAWLFALNLLAAVATFVELQLLRALTVVLSRPAPAPDAGCSAGDWAASGFPIDPAPCGASLPVLLLASYAVAVVAQSAVDLASLAGNTRLAARARADAERELLRNLLRQDDAFYLRRAPSEIISRLGSDLQRVGGRRQIAIQAISTALSVIAVAWVLASQSWLAALVGAVISVAGVLVAAPLLRRQRTYEQRLIGADEHVKAGFEDTLQGVAEIQVSGLLRGVLHRFQQRQAPRNRLAVQSGDLNSALTVSQRLTFSVGFIAALSLVVFTTLFRGSGDTAGLIVLLISSLPQLYFKFGDLTQLFSQFQLADVAAARLRQYEAPPPAPAALAPPAADGAIVLNRVRYQFSGSHAAQGGPDGISLTLPPRGLVGIVGPAGAGKSTLMRLVLGRQRPTGGSVAYPGEAGPAGQFVYLPQRPILFDASLRDNLFLASAPAALGGALERLGLLDLIRQKGLDAMPGADASPPADLAGVRAGFRQAAEAALGAPLVPFGPGAAAPRQMVVEALLGCAADQDAIAERLTSAHSREAVRALAAGPMGGALARLAAALVRQTAPLLAEAATPDEYNRAAPLPLQVGVWQLRRAALDLVAGAADGEAPHPPPALLAAVALSARLEEVGVALPTPSPACAAPLAAIVAGVARPLDAGALNPLLTWRENLLFAAAAPGNSRRLDRLDRVVAEHLSRQPFDRDVLEAGLDSPVGRQGGRLSGGQQQLVGIGRALLSPAPFLVLDEPSSALHPGLRARLLEVLRAEAQRRAVLVVTHDMDLARGCERIVFVRDGAIAGDGAWPELARQPSFEAWVAEGAAA